MRSLLTYIFMKTNIAETFTLVSHEMLEITKSIKIHHIQMLLFSCMVAGYFYFGYVDFVGPFSLGVVSLLVLFLVSCLNYFIRSDRTISNPHIIISVVLILMALWLYVVDDVPVIRLQKMFVVPIVLIFAVRGGIKSIRQVNNALIIIAVIVSISCIFAVLQALDIDFFWDTRMLLGVAERGAIEYQLVNRIKAPGLAFFSVPLSYQISAIFPFVIYLTYISTARRKIIILGLCLVLGALASKSLSSILAILVSFIVFMKLNHLLRPKRVLGFILILLLLAIGFSYYNGLISRIVSPDHTVLSRIPFTVVGVKILLHSPLGISGNELMDLMNYYLVDFRHILGAKDIFEFGFHNCLLTFGVTYGWAVFIMYIWLYIYIFRLIYKPLKKSTMGSDDHYFYSGAIAYFCSYLIQSSTHSAGLMTGDPYDWIPLAVILTYKPSLAST